MFEGIKSLIRDTRIKFDYPRYEKEQMVAHRAEAERRFNVGQLQSEVSVIRHQARLTGDHRFSDKINPLCQQITVLKQDIHRTLGQLVILERDYKSELDELYDRKKQLLQSKKELLGEMKRLQSDRSDAHYDLKVAYEDLEDAKDDVDHWYGRSERTPWLFGNGGKQLPKHSFFGQSFGDLEAAKSQRGDAVYEIGKCKSRIAGVKVIQAENRRKLELNYVEIGWVCDKIAAAKASRKQMFELKKEGLRLGTLRQKLRDYLSSQASLENQQQTLEKQRNALIEETECRMGLREREATIAELLARKTQFMDEFHSEQSRAARLSLHRRQWLAG